MPDYPALEAYNRHRTATTNPWSGVYATPLVMRSTADRMRDECEARLDAKDAEIKALEAGLAAERAKRCGTCHWFQMKHWSPRPQCMCEECSFDEEPSPDYGCVHWQSAEQGGES